MQGKYFRFSKFCYNHVSFETSFSLELNFKAEKSIRFQKQSMFLLTYSLEKKKFMPKKEKLRFSFFDND